MSLVVLWTDGFARRMLDHVVDRRVATPEEKDTVWVCSHKGCDFAVRQPRKPKNHQKHPADPMVRAS